MLDRIRRRIPRPLKDALRPAYLLGLDLADLVTGHRRRDLPPSRIMLPQYGRRDPAAFFEVGRWLVEDLERRCALRPHHRVLDVGCGAGRLARALETYLDERGGYEGFDVDARSIAWARRHISSRFPRARFRLVNVGNRQYNPAGAVDASQLRFPYDDGSFDVVHLHSVFTHLLPPGVERYLSEIRRVLKPGGRTHISYYLLNADAERHMGEKEQKLHFLHDFGPFKSISRETPEYSVAYREEFVRELYRRHRLTIEEPIHLGGWCGRPGRPQHQDIVVAVRRDT
jgi:SAM-dependent methyltransferase